MDIERLIKFLLIGFDSEHAGEVAAAINKAKDELKRDGKDKYWIADQLKGKGNGFFKTTYNQAELNAEYARGVRQGSAVAQRDRQAALDAAYRRGEAAERARHATKPKQPDMEDFIRGFEANHPDPLKWDGGDPATGETMEPHRWCAWLLARRKNRLSQWEVRFCTDIARQMLTKLTISENQREKLVQIIRERR